MKLVLDNLEYLLTGAFLTLQITLISMFFGILIGLITAIARLKGNRVLRGMAKGYVSIIRGTPLMVQIFIVYFGLPDLGIQLSPMMSAYISMSLNVGAYLSETFRATILSVEHGQTEAAQSLGMTPWQTMRYVILPQAARIAIPPLGNTFIGMLKETSLISVVTVVELFRAAQILIARYYVAMPFLIAIGIMYWIMSTGLSIILNRVEKRLSKAY
ncbi:L-cystine transport system permease protein YecS [Paenibacillus faecis]|uniref:Amino acid ABC transporter permease n=1 Tax=Paenibacillus faecis TaxID=862114 RepID=A0A5D0CZ10_9BACL|nr:amino acid ABC transporter permease [Paenibacillus faecis]TYA15282.1 amino acid ABC transporter permease [Paenibacillus faecis]GIO84702.1 L-cystine transport system permease protein YecS [Paenibacillus faecis]